jgi:hypothetical protein
MNLFRLALAFSAVAVSAAENVAPEPKPTPGPPVPAPASRITCPTDRSKCIDEHDSCQRWSMRGLTPPGKKEGDGLNAWMDMKKNAPKKGNSECFKNPDYMLKRCSQSCCTICNTCPGDVRDWRFGTDEAKNKHELQPAMDETENPEAFYSQCQKDKHALCPQWAEEGECEDRRFSRNPAKPAIPSWLIDMSKQTNHLWMHVNCMSSCCPGCPKSCPVNRDECRNSYSSDSSCLRWSQAGECSKNPTWMNENCARECCPVCRPEPVPVPQLAPPQPRYYPQQRQVSYPQQRQASPFRGYGMNTANPYGPYNIYG